MLETIEDTDREIDLVVDAVAFECAEAIAATTQAGSEPGGRIIAELNVWCGPQADHVRRGKSCDDRMRAQDGVDVTASHMVPYIQTQSPLRSSEVLHSET